MTTSRPDYAKAARVQSSKSFIFTTLIESALGPIPALIISKLYSNGKLNLRDIASRINQTRSKTKQTLVMLIQLRCVKYYTSGKNTVYSVNEEGFLALLYAGEIISFIDSKYDSTVAEVAQNFLSYGNLSLNDYTLNFLDENDFEARQSVEKSFSILVHDGWIVPIISSKDFQDREEIYKEIYQRIFRRHPKSTGMSETKRKYEVKVQTEIEFNSLFKYNPEDIYVPNEDANAQFLKLLAGGLANLEDSEELMGRKIKPEVSFRFNVARYLKHLRTEALEKFANQRLGPVTAKIYRLILEKVERRSPDCFRYALDIESAHLSASTKIEAQSANVATGSLIPSRSISHYVEYAKHELDPEKINTFTLRDISFLVEKNEIDLKDTIMFKSNKKRTRSGGDNGHASKKIKHEEGEAALKALEEVVEEVDDDEQDDSLTGLLFQHFELLAESTFPFLRKNANGTYFVPFAEIIPEHQQMTYLYLIKAVLGPDEFKVLNCIIKNKLIDEKALINQSLLNENVLRVCVNKLFKLQAIEVQEIPKTMDRQANRSAFAYRFNKKFSLELIESGVLHEMANIYVNIKDIKERNKLLLIKADREDIKGKEEEMLSVSDINQLKWIKETETNCVGRTQRARRIWETFALF